MTALLPSRRQMLAQSLLLGLFGLCLLACQGPEARLKGLERKLRSASERLDNCPQMAKEVAKQASLYRELVQAFPAPPSDPKQAEALSLAFQRCHQILFEISVGPCRDQAELREALQAYAQSP